MANNGSLDLTWDSQEYNSMVSFIEYPHFPMHVKFNMRPTQDPMRKGKCWRKIL